MKRHESYRGRHQPLHALRPGAAQFTHHRVPALSMSAQRDDVNPAGASWLVRADLSVRSPNIEGAPREVALVGRQEE